MSRTASFLFALVIYSALVAVLFFSLRAVPQQVFGNSTIELLSEDFDFGGSEINQSGIAKKEDLLAQDDLQTQESPIDQSSTLTQQKPALEPTSRQSSKPAPSENPLFLQTPQQTPAPRQSPKPSPKQPPVNSAVKTPMSVDDLFNALDVVAPPPSRQISEAKKRAAKTLQNTLANTNTSNTAAKVAKSKGENSGRGAQTMGLFDQYFSRINLYLKSKWSLVVRAFAGISESDELILAFKITPSGELQMQVPSRANLPIEQAAAQFAALINAEGRNFGPPPAGKEFRASARLGLRFSASIK